MKALDVKKLDDEENTVDVTNVLVTTSVELKLYDVEMSELKLTDEVCSVRSQPRS